LCDGQSFTARRRPPEWRDNAATTLATLAQGMRRDTNGSLPMRLLLPLLVLVLLPLYVYWDIRRVKAMVAAWAALNRCRMLESRRAWFPPLGMFLTTSKYQVIVRIRVYDETTHRIRNGWLRLGSYWLGLLDANAIEVRWADD
jgi:hypothetical protein